jgi:hypothetical protein
MVHSDNDGERQGLRLGITIGLVLWVAVILAKPASACSQHDPCTADAIDGFFLPLITSSLGRRAVAPPLHQCRFQRTYHPPCHPLAGSR